MATIYTMVGLPGAGKSTFSAAHPDCVVVSLDGIRGELYGDESIQGNGKEVIGLAFSRIAKSIGAGKDVIFDATNVSIKRRRVILNSFKHASHVAVYVATPLNECKRRNASRARHVPEHVIDKMAMSLVPPTTLEGFEKIIVII